MATHPPRTSAPRARGFTLVELLVVITIIGMLMALLIPAVGAARSTARRTQCSSNLGQLGKAMFNYEQTKQRYPGYVQSQKNALGRFVGMSGGLLAGSSYSAPTGGGAFTAENSYLSWAAMILPQIERQDIWDSILEPNNTGGIEIKPIEAFLCPADTDLTALEDNAGLSYSANTGAWDLDNGGAPINITATTGDTKANGLFLNHVRASGLEYKTRLSGIKDGQATTILFSENIQKNGDYTWFGVRRTSANDSFGEQQFGIVWTVSVAPGDEATTDKALFQLAPSQENLDLFSGDYPKDAAAYARPSSKHPGGAFNIVFADSHVLTRTPDIDYTVYQQLLAADNRRCVNPQDHTSTGGAINTFRTAAPVSETDIQ